MSTLDFFLVMLEQISYPILIELKPVELWQQHEVIEKLSEN